MTDLSWNEEATRYLRMTRSERQQWLARLLFSLTIFARDTYVVGGDDLNDSKRMRRFNELMHRVASQLRGHLEDSPGRSDEVFLKIVGDEMLVLNISSTNLIQMLRG